MSVHADPLRNTLDHLALDPKAKEDRRYLVSMLRRLGYTDAEIEEALGPIGGKRVIEVEYGGARHVGGMRVAPPGRETTFSVVDGEPGFDEGRQDWQAEWPDEEVTFRERAPGEGPVGFSVARGEVHGAPPAQRRSALQQDDETGGWILDDDTPWRPRRRVAGDPALEHGWTPVTDDELAAGWEPVADDAPVDSDEWKIEDAPGDAWTPAQDDTVQWQEETSDDLEEGWVDEPFQEAQPALADTHDAPAKALDAPTETHDAPVDTDAFRYEDYTLYTRMVELSTGREQRIYFFAKTTPKSGTPCPLPEGYRVEQNERTGLPFLRRDVEAPSATPQPVVSENEDDGGWDAEDDSWADATQETSATATERWDAPTDEGAELETKCQAVTKAGTPCSRNAREDSRFCGIHKGRE